MSRTFYRAPGMARARLPRVRAQETVNRVVALRRPAKLPEIYLQLVAMRETNTAAAAMSAPGAEVSLNHSAEFSNR